MINRLMIQRLAGKRIWVMAKGYAPDEGGQQSYARQVAAAYARLGGAVTVLTQTSAGPRDEEQEGVRLIDLGPGKGAWVPFRWIAAVKALEKSERHPDLCHATTWRTSIPPLACGIPYVTTFHGREFMRAGGAAGMALTAVMRRARLLVAVSHYSASLLRPKMARAHIDPARLVVAWNGCTTTPLPRVAARPGDPLRIMTLCRLEPRKNLLAAVQAVEQVIARGHAVEYIICGRGPDQAAIAQHIARSPASASIRMAGYVSDEDARALHARSDIFLHPQIALDDGRDFEGFGLAVADAMRAGCVAIVGREGGSAELVTQGKSGFIVNGREPDEIARIIIGLATDDARLSALSAASVERSMLFDWDRHVGALLERADL